MAYTFTFTPEQSLNVRRALREHIDGLKDEIVNAVETGRFTAAQTLTERMREEQKALDLMRQQLATQDAA